MGLSIVKSRSPIDLPPSTSVVLAPFIMIAGALATVYIYTTIRYHFACQDFVNADNKSAKPNFPPKIPYTIPILGHVFSFLSTQPGQYWNQLLSSHPRLTGACTLNLGGKTTHILFSPHAIQALFKTRSPSRDGFNMDIVHKALGLDLHQCLRYFGIGEGPDHTGITPVHQQEDIHNLFLLENKAVDELTTNFMRSLNDQIKSGSKAECAEKEVQLYAWLRDKIFTASTTALMGSRLLEIYPDLPKDFFVFDSKMLTMFFGIPRWFSPSAYKVRDKAVSGLIEWQQQMQAECKGIHANPAGSIDWEPLFGSRANRARQRYYESRGLNTKTRAGMDLALF